MALTVWDTMIVAILPALRWVSPDFRVGATVSIKTHQLAR